MKSESKLHRREEKLHHIAEKAMEKDERVHKEIEKGHRREEKAMVKKGVKRKKTNKVLRKHPIKSAAKIERVMKEYKHGELHSGSKMGPKVKSRKQAIAIALSEARRASKKK